MHSLVVGGTRLAGYGTRLRGDGRGVAAAVDAGDAGGDRKPRARDHARDAAPPGRMTITLIHSLHHPLPQVLSCGANIKGGPEKINNETIA